MTIAVDGGVTRLRAFDRANLDRQGFGDLDDRTKSALNVRLRFTPALCLVLTLAAVLTTTAWALGVLATFAAAAALGLPHPFDVLFNVVVRPAVRGPALPPNPAPRRLAFAIATAFLGGAAVALAFGASALGVGLGLAQVAGCGLYVSTGWCPAAFIHEKVASREPQ